MRFYKTKHPLQIKYRAKGKDSIFHVIKNNKKYELFQETNSIMTFIICSELFSFVKKIAKEIELDINTKQHEAEQFPCYAHNH